MITFWLLMFMPLNSIGGLTDQPLVPLGLPFQSAVGVLHHTLTPHGWPPKYYEIFKSTF